MAEANLPTSRSSSGQFDMTPVTPEQFIKLNPCDQRKEYERIYDSYMTYNEQSKSQSIESNDTEPRKSLKKEDLDGSSVVDPTLVGGQSANPNETLVEALEEKNVRYDKLEQKASDLLRDLQDREQQLQNANIRIDDMKSVVKEIEKNLAASMENCNQLIIQVDNSHDELEDRDITIRMMAQSARRDQERNAEISAHMEVLQSGQEQIQAENRTLRQQIREEMRRNQILRNLLQMIARRSLRQERPPSLIIQPLSLPVSEVIPDSLG